MPFAITFTQESSIFPARKIQTLHNHSSTDHRNRSVLQQLVLFSGRAAFPPAVWILKTLLSQYLVKSSVMSWFLMMIDAREAEATTPSPLVTMVRVMKPWPWVIWSNVSLLVEFLKKYRSGFKGITGRPGQSAYFYWPWTSGPVVIMSNPGPL